MGEHPGTIRDARHGITCFFQKPRGFPQAAISKLAHRAVKFPCDIFQPEFGALVDGLEKQFIPVHHLLRIFLQAEQLVGAQVSFIIRSGGTGKLRGG